MRGALVLSLVALVGCDQVFGLDLPDPTGDGGTGAQYAFRKRVTLTSPVTEDLVQVPIALLIEDDDELRAIVGEDFAIRSADGRDLSFELEDLDLDSSDGADLRAWILLESFPANSPTVLYVHYGERSGPPGENAPLSVWPDEYGAVWHFTAEGQADHLLDSTRHINTLRFPTVDHEPLEVNGLVHHGRQFDGVNDTLVATHNATIDAGDSSFTYSVWVNIAAATPVTPYAMPLYKGGASMAQPGYDIELGDGVWLAQISDGGDGGDGLDDVDQVNIPTAGLLGGWVHLVAVVDRDRSAFTVYVNGGEVGSTLLEEGSLASTDDLQISPNRPNDLFAGIVDEVRLYHGVLTPDRIRLEYLNLSQPQTLLQVAPHEPLR